MLRESVTAVAPPSPHPTYSGLAMKTDTERFAARSITGLLLPTMLFMSTAQAADTVQWADLAKTIGHGKTRSDNREDREYRVVTKAGAIYVGQGLSFSPVAVSVNPLGLSIPREQVAEIRIHRDRRLTDALVAPGGKVMDSICGGDLQYCFVLFLPLIPVAIGAMALAAPLILPIEGVKRLLPDRVVKVAP
jgi:hypothetical protein